MTDSYSKREYPTTASISNLYGALNVVFTEDVQRKLAREAYHIMLELDQVKRRLGDAMHAVWCGPECPNGPGCTQWQPNRAEQRAAIEAIRLYDMNQAFRPS